MSTYGIKAISITVKNTIVNQIQMTLLKSLIPTLTIPEELQKTTTKYLSKDYLDTDIVDTTFIDPDYKALLFEYTHIPASDLPIYNKAINTMVNEYINKCAPSNYPLKENSYVHILKNERLFETHLNCTAHVIKLYVPVTSGSRLYTSNIDQLQQIFDYIFDKTIINLRTFEATEYMQSKDEVIHEIFIEKGKS